MLYLSQDTALCDSFFRKPNLKTILRECSIFPLSCLILVSNFLMFQTQLYKKNKQAYCVLVLSSILYQAKQSSTKGLIFPNLKAVCFLNRNSMRIFLPLHTDSLHKEAKSDIYWILFHSHAHTLRTDFYTI